LTQSKDKPLQDTCNIITLSKLDGVEVSAMKPALMIKSQMTHIFSSIRFQFNRVLRTILGPKRDEVTGQWRKLHSEELHNLYSSPDIIRQVKSRRMRWAGHVARMGEERSVQGFGGKSRGKETSWKTKA
jgi:hypothetical protein